MTVRRENAIAAPAVTESNVPTFLSRRIRTVHSNPPCLTGNPPSMQLLGRCGACGEIREQPPCAEFLLAEWPKFAAVGYYAPKLAGATLLVRRTCGLGPRMAIELDS